MRSVLAVLGVAAVLLGGALLRGWLVPPSDAAPEAYRWRLRWPGSPSAEVTLFFPTPEGALAAVRRRVSSASPAVILAELAAGPAPGSGLEPALPAGMVVESAVVSGDVAVVRVAGASPDGRALDLMALALAGQAASLQVETDVGSETVPVPGVLHGVTYLWRGLPVPVAADVAGDPAAALRRLLAGPPPPGVEPMPAGMSLLDVTIKGDLARVSLGLSPHVTEELTAGRWQFAPQAMAIVYTLTDQPGIRRVQFDFPDLPEQARRNCRTPLGVPLMRPEAEPGRVKGGVRS